MNELTSKAKGNLTELQCITAFYELGFQVSIPYGENSRYDFIADINGVLIRVQVKTAQQKNPDTITFSTRSTRINAHKNISCPYTAKEIDYFSTYWNNQCYLIPINETCSTAKTLRFNPPKNAQIKGIKLASDYELIKQIQKILGE